jgi:histidinol-phosphate aminotransferase
MTPPVRPRPDIEMMAGYHSPQVDVPVRLNTNECPTPPPQSWREELVEAMDGLAWNRYPDRAATALRARLAERHGVDATQVFAANGSNEVLQSLCLAYGGSGRTVATFEPTYALHGHIARTTGAAVTEYERTDDFTLAPDVLDEAVAAAPAITFLCSPNNPTGRVEPAALIGQAVDGCADAGSLLVVDEAYGQFAPWSALEMISSDRPLVVCRTFSKTWAMAGARLGYCVAPGWVVEQLEKVVLPYHLDAVTQLAGRLALDHEDAMRARVEAIVAERERMVLALDEMPVTSWPSGANFVLFRPGRPGAGDDRTGDAVWRQLLDRGVLVRNCSSWPRLAGCLRVTVGTPAENDTFLDALSEVMS